MAEIYPHQIQVIVMDPPSVSKKAATIKKVRGHKHGRSARRSIAK